MFRKRTLMHNHSSSFYVTSLLHLILFEADSSNSLFQISGTLFFWYIYLPFWHVLLNWIFFLLLSNSGCFEGLVLALLLILFSYLKIILLLQHFSHNFFPLNYSWQQQWINANFFHPVFYLKVLLIFCFIMHYCKCAWQFFLNCKKF